ncbi:SH3 domain-containing protein [Sphingomonas sp.]|uniref:SH3 domain-containing protein n=1 Tax=Sphingomonas sp. TaxID=28214 RepID=UPI0035C7A0C9
MRSGPGRTYPATWLYVRADLPVRVVDTFKEWRKVEDPSGTQGWFLGTLVSSTRTAIVQGDVPAPMHERAGGGKLLWRAAPGVVGRLSQCQSGWCRFDVHGQAGWVETSRLWGVEQGEVLP